MMNMYFVVTSSSNITPNFKLFNMEHVTRSAKMGMHECFTLRVLASPLLCCERHSQPKGKSETNIIGRDCKE